MQSTAEDDYSESEDEGVGDSFSKLPPPPPDATLEDPSLTTKKGSNYLHRPRNPSMNRASRTSSSLSVCEGRSRAISLFNSDPTLKLDIEQGERSAATQNVELKKQHLRGIFAAACTDYDAKGGTKMLLREENLKKAITMTGLYPSRALLSRFSSGGGKPSANLSKFIAVILENLHIDRDVSEDLQLLFETFGNKETGEISVSSLRRLLSQVSPNELSTEEAEEFLLSVNPQSSTINYEALISNFMVSKIEVDTR